MKQYWLKELSPKLQKQIEKRMVELVTNKEAEIVWCDDEDGYVWVQTRDEDCSNDEGESIGVRREENEYNNCANYFIDTRGDCCAKLADSDQASMERETYVEIIMEKLPKRVLALLAVIHRPVYELYKKRVLGIE